MCAQLFIEDNSALLLTDEFNRRYFSGVEVAEGFVVRTNTQTAYFADARYFYALAQKLKGSSVKSVLYKSLESIKEYLVEQDIKTLYVPYDVVTVNQFNAYKAMGFAVKDGTDIISTCRKEKSKKEIESIKKACKIASDAFDYILPFIKKGVTEKSIKNRLERFMKKQGAEKPSFDTIVAFGKNSAVPHHETGNTKLKDNQAVLMDYGCVINGYCSDITRTVFYGQPTKEFKETFYHVAGANLLGMDRAIAGASAKEVDGRVREYFENLGVQEYFTHSLGHGVGLEIHEQPYLSSKSTDVLKENYAFTIEPGLYYDGKFGVRIENTVLIEDGVAKSLTGNGRELIIIE